MPGFKFFLRAQPLLAGFGVVQMIRKGQHQRPPGDGLCAAKQFDCWLPAKPATQRFDLTLIMRHNLDWQQVCCLVQSYYFPVYTEPGDTITKHYPLRICEHIMWYRI